MSNENHNDFHWRNKLEDAGSLQEQILTDKNVIWEKLYSRLHQKPGRIRRFWYFAAACSFLIVLIPMMVTIKNNSGLVKNYPTQIKSKKVIDTDMLPSKETLASVSFPTITKNEVTARSVQKNNKKSRLDDVAKKTKTIIANADVQRNMEDASVITVENAIGSSLKTTIVVAPVKKKLKVVHLNELGDPVEEAAISKSYEYHAFQFKLINKQADTYSSLPVNNTGFNILKLKHTPSN